MSLIWTLAVLSWGIDQGWAQTGPYHAGKYNKMRSITQAEREAAAANFKELRQSAGEIITPLAAPTPGGVPDYFGPYSNYANSPLPVGPIGKIVVNVGGSGYANPVVTITDAYGAGTGAGAATATIGVGGIIAGITGGLGGTGYIAPSVSIVDVGVGGTLLAPTCGAAPLPACGTGAIATATVTPGVGTGMRKFVDTLPIPPFAVPDTTTYPGSDYYEIELGEYTQIMHSDLPATLLRGYRQTNASGPPSVFTYLGPIIVAQRDRPVRIKFTNNLPTGAGGDLFLPVDTSYMGAGFVPSGTGYSATEKYKQNRAAIHLHGATTPWISDGTLHQWITPAGETTSYPQGVSVQNVPDMWYDPLTHASVPAGTPGATNDPGPGTMTFFYTNQQSARLMFYHDHALGITRLNVYGGMAAGYVVTDAAEQALFGSGGTFAALGEGIPLVIQDKSFVPGAAQLAAQDPTWDTLNWGQFGDLWFPHVYMPNQNPWDLTGANAMGRWDYGPWFWPPFTNLIYGPIPNPYCLPTPPATPTSTTWNCSATPWEPPFIPGVPNVSGTPESFMDTPVVNGRAYPTLNVPAGPVRFRILSVGNDRTLNLSLWVAADKTSPTTAGSTGTVLCTNNATVLPANCTEVKMVPWDSTQNTAAPFPNWWYDNSVANPFDGRIGGVPDPATRGPAMIQIATEGGFLPAPAVIKNQPVNYVMNKRDITVGNIKEKALFLGPAERADIIVDFTNFAGKTLILYNDAPAATPAGDPRLDYFTGDLDMTATGGAPSTLPGYGPNTRTIMQIVVGGTSAGPTIPVDNVNATILSQLQTALPPAFKASQDVVIVPQAAYNPVYGTAVTDVAGSNLIQIQATSTSFTPLTQAGTLQAAPVLFNFQPKSIIEDFQMDYGRMNAILGVEVPHTNVTNQTSIIQTDQDPPTEVIKISDPTTTPIGTLADGTQIWKITHNGVDTHAIHFHMFTVQVVNRVGWDGAIRPPDPNELGFKDTVRMNPLEDIIVAIRPIKLTLPFKVPNSIRPLAPEAPIGATVGPTGMGLFTNVNPQGLPVTITNQYVNYGWEYVWHCHILGHEENDMMRAMALAAPPDAPSNLVVTPLTAPPRVNLTWTDNSVNATGFTIQRASDIGFTAGLTTFVKGIVTANPQTYTDTTILAGTPYYYRVLASNTVGSTVPGYPQVTADSAWSNTATNVTALTVGFSATPPSPVAVGNSVTFNASAVGGLAPYQFYFTWRDTALGWHVGQAYSATSSWIWDTTGLTPGTYMIQVWVRNTGSTAPYDAFATVMYNLAGPAVTSVALTPTPASPRLVGTSITFNAAATGGVTPQYYFTWRDTALGWHVGQAYSATSSWIWNTTGLPAGAYMIQVWARSAGSGSPYEAFAYLFYTLY